MWVAGDKDCWVTQAGRAVGKALVSLEEKKKKTNKQGRGIGWDGAKNYGRPSCRVILRSSLFILKAEESH
jgi:hypothetical protein